MDRLDFVEKLRELTSKDVPIAVDPIPDVITRFVKQTTQTKAEQEDDIAAYLRLCEMHAAEPVQKTRTVLQQFLNFVLDHGEMRLSYCMINFLPGILKKEKRLQRRMYPEHLQLLVGDDIARALNWETINVQPGTSFAQQPGITKNLRHRYGDWTATEMDGAFIEIGKHKFALGDAVSGVLKSLEDRYGIDFKAMERKVQRRKKRTQD